MPNNLPSIVIIFVGITSMMNITVSSVFALPNVTSDMLNKTQDTKKMMLKLLFSNSSDDQSSINLSKPILNQTDHNTNFKILPNITGIVTEEIPFVGNGSIKGISYNHIGFFSGVWNINHKLLQYHGAVNLTTVDGDAASYSLSGLSKIDSNGDIQGKGIAFFNTNSSGPLSSLNGIKILYKDEIKNPAGSDSPHRIIGWEIGQPK